MWSAVAAISWRRRREAMVAEVAALARHMALRKRGRLLRVGLAIEDAVQECLLTVWLATPKHDPTRLAWEYYAAAVIRNRLIGLMKDRLWHRVWDQDAGQHYYLEAQPTPDPLELEEVMTAFAKLEPTDQKILQMRHWDDQTYQQVGEAMGASTRERGRQLVQRALSRLARLVG